MRSHHTAENDRDVIGLPRLRIVLVSTMFPSPDTPPPGGRWMSVLLHGLVARGHRVTMLVPCHTQEQQRRARVLFPSPLYDLRAYVVQPQAPSWLARKVATLRQPYSYMFSADLRRDLAVILRQPWDILHLEDMWSGWLGLPYDRRKVVLNFHNLFCLDDGEAPEQTWRAAATRRLRHRTETRLARSYPTLMALSDQLAATLRQIAPHASIRVCPLGLDTSRYTFLPATCRPRHPVISLIGSMHWSPSLTAAERLLTRLWPDIKARVPTAQCLVVGWGANTALKDYLVMPDVEIVEDVPDIRPYFERTAVMVYAPYRGSGMKVKILEAFAYGVPVVTTPAGVEGLPARDGIHAGICEDDRGLIDRTVRLLQDRERQEHQRRSARQLLESHCSPQATLDTVERVYAQIVG